MVLGLGDRPHVRAEVERLRPAIERHAEIVVWDLGFTADLSSVQADLAFVFGGDGSILRAARQMGYHQIPVVGINMGKLGFLADLSPSEFERVLPELCCGQCRMIEHLMFECVLERQGMVVARDLGLNETAVLAGPPFTMLTLHLYVDAELVTTYSCDGLIVSTPIGSTAHNLSAGGPILRKDLQAFVVSPISPHTLTNRPVVEAADRVYQIEFASADAEAAVVVDGRVLSPLRLGDRVKVSRAAPRFKLLAATGHSYYRTLREKLGWGGSLMIEPDRGPRGQSV
jgi:NAD+ kinase